MPTYCSDSAISSASSIESTSKSFEPASARAVAITSADEELSPAATGTVDSITASNPRSRP